MTLLQLLNARNRQHVFVLRLVRWIQKQASYLQCLMEWLSLQHY